MPLPQTPSPPPPHTQQTTLLMPQTPKLLLRGALLSQAMGSSERTEALPTHPWPCPQARLTVTTRQCPSMGCNGAARACRALGESQSPCSDRPRAACLSQQGFPLEPPGQTATSRSLPVLLQPPKGVSVQESTGVDGYPFLPVSHTGCRWLWGHCPPSVSQAHPETHMRRAHADRVASACTYVHAEGPKPRTSHPAPTFGAQGSVSQAIGYVGCRGTMWHCEEF